MRIHHVTGVTACSDAAHSAWKDHPRIPRNGIAQHRINLWERAETRARARLLPRKDRSGGASSGQETAGYASRKVSELYECRASLWMLPHPFDFGHHAFGQRGVRHLLHKVVAHLRLEPHLGWAARNRHL